ncbi:MAG: xanthine dehydrogenase family protein subunit M [Pirellulaceae bacterium]
MKPIAYAAPPTVEAAVQLLAEHGERARVLAGGTDIIVQLREGRRQADVLVDIKRIGELNELSFDAARGLRIGAAVPCCRIYEYEPIARRYAALVDSASLIGGVQVQSRGSLGGNLCNASPAADSTPSLIALSAVCVVVGPEGRREVPADQFCTGPGRTVLGTGELLVGFQLPAPPPHSGSAYLRFIPRNEMDIAVAGAGVAVTLDERKQRCTAARIALAAVAPTPLFVREAAAVLLQGEISDERVEQAAAAAQAAARPISDMRGEAEYRRHLTGVLVRRALHQAIQRAKEN